MIGFALLFGGIVFLYAGISGRGGQLWNALKGGTPDPPTPALTSGVTQPPPSVNGGATQPTSGGALRVDTAPTITASQINTILDQYHSPAAGLGQTFYDQGVANGINPAVALAFFVHESTAGTAGVATHTRSIGNIRATGNEPAYNGFKVYPSWSAGIADYYRLIKNVYIGQWGLNTVDRIVPVYAPAGDGNNPTGYIQTIKDLIRGWMH